MNVSEQGFDSEKTNATLTVYTANEAYVIESCNVEYEQHILKRDVELGLLVSNRQHLVANLTGNKSAACVIENSVSSHIECLYSEFSHD